MANASVSELARSPDADAGAVRRRGYRAQRASRFSWMRAALPRRLRR